MKQITCKFEVLNGRVWARLSSSREPGVAGTGELLRWIAEQINIGNFESDCDAEGLLQSLVIGAAAAPIADDSSVDVVEERVKSRVFSVNVAGLFANAREEGIEPPYVHLAKQIKNPQLGGRQNTDLHYALEVSHILERIARLSFVFDSPPIKTRAGTAVIALLKEATRAYLFGLTRSSVSTCRALLEESLRERVSTTDVVDEFVRTKRGAIECLINVAGRKNVLNGDLVRKAHLVRKAGNGALHKAAPSDETAWRTLQGTRRIVTYLYR
jgi:hypothetical protein